MINPTAQKILEPNKKIIELRNENDRLNEQIKEIQKNSYDADTINALRNDSENLKSIKTKYNLLKNTCETKEKEYQTLKTLCENDENKQIIVTGDRNLRMEDAIEYIKTLYRKNNSSTPESEEEKLGVISMVENSFPVQKNLSKGVRQSRRHRRRTRNRNTSRRLIRHRNTIRRRNR